MLKLCVSLFYRFGLKRTALERVKSLSGNNIPVIFHTRLSRAYLLPNLFLAQHKLCPYLAFIQITGNVWCCISLHQRTVQNCPGQRNFQDKGHSLRFQVCPAVSGSCVHAHAMRWCLLGLILYVRDNVREATIHVLSGQHALSLQQR